MADTGFISAGTFASVAGAGADWSNPANATSSDNVYATCVLAGGQSTDPLRATNFDFSAIPSSDAISQIDVTVEAKSSGTGSQRTEIYLVVGGTRVGPNQITTPTTLPTTEGTVTYSWTGTDLAGIDVAAVQDSSFGVEVVFQTVLAGRTISVDQLQIKVTHDAVAGIEGALAASGASSASFLGRVSSRASLDASGASAETLLGRVRSCGELLATGSGSTGFVTRMRSKGSLAAFGSSSADLLGYDANITDTGRVHATGVGSASFAGKTTLRTGFTFFGSSHYELTGNDLQEIEAGSLLVHGDSVVNLPARSRQRARFSFSGNSLAEFASSAYDLSSASDLNSARALFELRQARALYEHRHANAVFENRNARAEPEQRVGA